MTQPLSQSLPSVPQGANFAPVKPLLALTEKNGHNSPYASHYFADAIKAKYNELIKYKESTFREIINVGQMTALFIEGKQILDWNPYTQTYAPRKLKNSDPNKIKAVNLIQYYTTQWQAKWGSSNPDIVLSPLSNNDQDIARVRKANTVVNHLERKMYDAWYNYHEGLMAQVFGWYGNRVRVCNKNGAYFNKPLFGEKEVQIGKGWGKCHDCEYSGNEFNSVKVSNASSMPLCPECGSTGVNYEPPISQLMRVVTGEERVKMPDIICEQLPFAACRWDPAYRAEDSSWFIYEQEIGMGTVRSILGDIRVPDGESGNQIGLEVMRSLAQMGSPVGGRSGTGGTTTDSNKTAVVTEMYLSADDLYDIAIQGDEKTVGGDMLPKTDHASEAFPNGACAVMLNGSLLVGLWPEHHSNSVTSGVYHMKPLSGTGRGIADALEIQKRFNREDSANVRHMESRARPATLHMAGAISPQDRKLLGQPDVDIPVNVQNFPEIRSVRDVIAPLQGEGIPGNVIQYTYQYLQDAMQRAMHTTGLGGANPSGVNNNTATYAELTAQTANDLFTPTLAIKADVRLKTAKKAFYLWVQNTPAPRFLSFDAPSKSGARGMEVSGSDVDGEYEWSVVPGSELPSDKLSKRKDTAAFYSLFQGGATGYFQIKAQFPQEVAEMERIFDMDMSTDNYDDVGETCRTRFEMAKGLMAQAMQMREVAAIQYGVQMPSIDPITLMEAVKPTLLVTESHLQEKGLWFSNLLDTTEGQQMPDEERSLVDAFVKTFTQLAQGQAIGIQTMENEAQVASNAPIQQNQLEQQQIEATQGQQQEMERSQQSHEQNVENKVIDAVRNEADNAAAHDRALELENVRNASSAN